MVQVDSLIRLFQKMYKEHWSYVWGSAKEGCVDCSGAFDYAFSKLHGLNYPHGSNSIARKFIVGKLLPVAEAKPGMVAFKMHKPGEDGYDLREKFLPGGSSYNGDLNDYYHIGLVDEDPNWVLNAKGTKYGFCRDALTGKNGWDFAAYLKGVDYNHSAEEKGDMIMQEAYVVLPSGASGSTVNMRKIDDKSGSVIAKVPVGSKIEIESDLGQWCKIRYNGKTGYMMSNYLEYDDQSDETNADTISPEDHQKIEDALKEIERQIDVIGMVIGRG